MAKTNYQKQFTPKVVGRGSVSHPVKIAKPQFKPAPPAATGRKSPEGSSYA